MLDFGEDPVGYTFSADNYPAAEILQAMVKAELVSPEFASDGDNLAITTAGMRYMAILNGVDYDDPHSYDSGDFPKPIFTEQLTCSDSEWTDKAPGHYWTPIGMPREKQSCEWCGKLGDE